MNFALPAPVCAALDRLNEAGYSAYAVGGCVRDFVLGLTPHDYDICTSAVPEEMRRVFKGERTLDTGVRHGTLTVLLSGMQLEITTYRVDGEYLDGRHPASVQFADRVEADLSRRDFTINAMAYSPRDGLKDPFGGQEDCRRGIVRCVGNPEERFHEDALRILRALRFSARLGFPIEEATARAVREGKDQLLKISRERIFAEMTGLLQGDHARETLFLFPEVIQTALPPLSFLLQSAQWPQTLDTLAFAPREPVSRWAAFLQYAAETPAASAALAEDVCKSLKMSVKMTEDIRCLVACRQDRLAPGALPEMMMKTGPDRLRKLILLRQAERLAKKDGAPEEIARDTEELLAAMEAFIREGACFTLSQLAVNGRDLTGLGFKGPAVGQALNALLLRVVRGQLRNDRETLLAAAREQKESQF